MEIRYPKDYRNFQCIAGACPDTCCAGWEIPVDRASERRYRAARKTMANQMFARKLEKYVRDGRIVSDDVTCPFLNRDGLCEMYIEMGPEALCHTCARHPRHLEDYGNLCEMVLLISCPEAARMLLEDHEDGFYMRQMPEKTGNLDGVDERFLEVLLEVRALVWELAKDERTPFAVRLGYIAALAHDIQRRICRWDQAVPSKSEGYSQEQTAAGRLALTDAERESSKSCLGEPKISPVTCEAIRDVCKKYRAPGAIGRFAGQWSGGEAHSRFLLMSDFMEELAGLETVCRTWPDRLERCRTKLYHSGDSRERYEERRTAFLKNEGTRTDFGRVFEYFIYSFLLGTLYDGDVLTKVKMAVLCTMAIEELYMAADSLELEDRVDICHALARQIENHDGNRSELERMLKQETFGARRIADALLEAIE